MLGSRLVDCITIEIDCVPNKCEYPEYDNPKYLGFFIRVDAKKYVKLLKYTLETLKRYNIPVVSVRPCKGHTEKSFLYDKRDILYLIMGNVEPLLKRQAEVEQEQLNNQSKTSLR